jgi:hypothetical protein
MRQFSSRAGRDIDGLKSQVRPPMNEHPKTPRNPSTSNQAKAALQKNGEHVLACDACKRQAAPAGPAAQATVPMCKCPDVHTTSRRRAGNRGPVPPEKPAETVFYTSKKPIFFDLTRCFA